MTLLRREVLIGAGRKNLPLRKWLDGWSATVEREKWENIDDLRASFPSADGVMLPGGTVVTIFNVKGGHYRLLVMIDYRAESIEALDVMTHAEYDKMLWKSRY